LGSAQLGQFSLNFGSFVIPIAARDHHGSIIRGPCYPIRMMLRSSIAEPIADTKQGELYISSRTSRNCAELKSE